MSLALAKAAKLRPEIRLAQALSEFEASLVDDQKTAYRESTLGLTTPGPREVGRFTAEIDLNAQRRKSRQCIGPRLARFLQAVQQFCIVVDIAVGGSHSQIGCAVWGVVKFSLQAASISTYFDDLSNLIMIISKTCPIHREFEMLYPSSDRLQKALCEYYIAVTRLCSKIIAFLGKGIVKQISSAVLNPFKSAFGGLQAELDRLSGIVQFEITLASQKSQQVEIIENTKLRALVSRFSEAQSQEYKERQARRQRKARACFLNACSTYDNVTAWKQARKQGNVSWFTSSQDYKEWKKTGGVLWCSGIVGSGKSVLTANVIDDVRLDEDTTVVAYLLCRHDEVESLESATITRSIFRQILECAPSNLQEDYWNLKDFDDDTLLHHIGSLSTSFTRGAYIIVDGIDECTVEERDVLLTFLRDLLGRTGDVLHIYCASRSDVSYQSSLVLRPRYRISMSENNDELASYISETLQERIESGRLPIKDPEIKERIHTSLLAHADGMYLWVRFHIEDLCSQRTDAQILETLHSLPRGLPETLNRILRKLYTSHSAADVQLCQSLCQIVLGARRPLTLSELREAVSVDPAHPRWDPRRQINDIASAVTCAGSLLVTDEEDLTIHFAHSSVKEHLLMLGTNYDTTVSQYGLTKSKADLCFAEICVTYLGYSGKFDRRILRSKNNPSRLASADMTSTSSVFKDITTKAPTTSRLAREVLRLRTRKRDTISGQIGEAYQSILSQSSTIMEDPHPLLPYIQEHWLIHTKALTVGSNQLSIATKAFRKLVGGGNDLVALPWSSQDYIDFSDSFQRWLTNAQHWPIIELVMQEMMEGRFPSCPPFAVKSWQVRSYGEDEFGDFLLLLPKLEGPYQVQDLYSNALHRACSLGIWKWARILIDKYADLDVELDHKTALEAAASKGFDEVVHLLLRNRADPNMKGAFFGGPLVAACLNGHERVVRHLLDHGASLAIQPQAFTAAFKNGNKDVLKLLSQHASLNPGRNGVQSFSRSIDANSIDASSMVRLWGSQKEDEVQ